MKTESTAKYVLRLAGTLLLITSVVAALLAGVNSITAPKIAELSAQKTQEAIEAVLPGGGEEVAFTDDTGLVTTVYQGEAGYAVKVAPVGFDSAITMMVGVDTEGNVLGISVIDQSETAGLGAVCAASTSAGEAFRGQFVGMSGEVTVSKDGGQVDAITGATITSRAVCKGVSAALACVANMG
ncbi:MAG: RnfABCDGE type electron transport complex subunit G [Oscillospiraceae bacterium]|nr:RnfABCDGE type electron transport complex subunit G [Oscillospiraceae bacterium]